MRNIFISLILMICAGCATVQPVTKVQDYNMSCSNLKQQIAILEPQVEREQNIQTSKEWIGFIVTIAGSAIGAYNDSWEAVGGSYAAGDIIGDWNDDAYDNNKDRLQHLKNLAISKGCYNYDGM